MEGDSDAIQSGALDDIAYLARSSNRITLLNTLASGTHARRALTEQTDVARTTIGRILNEFEERGWVERTTEGEYTATPIGKQVITEFMPLVESMAVIRTLRETVAWLQATEQHIDLQHLRDATVWRPEPADPMAPAEAYMDDLRTATEFQCLVGVAPPESFEKAMRDGVVERGMRVEHIISEGEYMYLLDYPDRLQRWREYIDAGANVYCYAGTVSCNLMIFDGTTYIAKTQSEFGEPYTVIESDNDAVLSWALDVIERYRNSATQLDSGAFMKEMTD